MDEIVKVRRSFLSEIRGLFRAFRTVCDTCYRNECTCYFAEELARAKEMIEKIDNVRNAEEERFYVDNPVEEFMARIVRAIQQGGGKPVRSDNIRIPGECRQRKARALKTLVKRGVVRRIEEGGSPFYVLASEGATRENNKQGERHGV